MSTLKGKIDFVALVSVSKANSNGDPLNGNRPRTDYNGFGEISDVCIKRKIRNRMQDLGHTVFVQSEDRCDDGCKSLKDRAVKVMKEITDQDIYAKKACETWMDVRSFGQVFAYSGKKSSGEKKDSASKGVSVGVRGPVSIHQAVSFSPVEIESLQITKSVSGEIKTKKDDSEAQEGGENLNNTMTSDRMGMKHFVRYGLYEIKGSINVQLAEKTGFSEEDADVIKECLRTLFVNDASSARPDGSMEVVKLFWWKHNCKDGQYSSARVHRSVHVKLKDNLIIPTGCDDYEISVDSLPGLEPEIIDGL